MSFEERPDPDQLLQAIQQSESVGTKGHLKIFLGMAAGVGKTYAMLEAAQSQHHNGVKVVVGVIETHGRLETAALLEGLPIIPPQFITYRGTVFKELNLSAILNVKPQLVLVDELAHSNIPGALHAKRWQDIIEILNNGIDVYSTLNVQHIESLKDFVESITGISIRETVPDSIVESAASIEVIDITPEELLERLRQGKVYLGDKSEIAAHNFFRKDRLTALREIVLRYAAEKIDHDLHGMVLTAGHSVSWKHREKLLVAVNSTVHSQKLIRTTRRLAFNLNAPWIALHVNDGSYLEPNEQAILAKNLSIARDLGAEIMTIEDSSISKTIARTARHHGVTQVIVGQVPPRWAWGAFFSRTLIDQLVQECADIDIHIVRKSPSEAGKIFLHPIFPALYPYLLVGLIVLIWHLLFNSRLSDTILIGTIGWAAVFFIQRERHNQKMLLKRQKNIETLYEMAKEIATKPTSFLIHSIRQKIGQLLNVYCEIVVKRMEGHLSFLEAPELASDEKEKAVAEWVFKNDKEAGWSTVTLGSAKNMFLPIKDSHDVVGVLTCSPRDPSRQVLFLEEKSLLYTIGKLLASHLKRSFEEEQRHKLEYSFKTEKIYQSILSFLSSQLKTPLQLAHNYIQSLQRTLASHDQKINVDLVCQLENCSEELIETIENISGMAKFCAGLAPTEKKPHSINELIETCHDHLKKYMGTRKASITILEGGSSLFFDFALLEILLCNLMVSALDHSSSDSPIEIQASQKDQKLFLEVSNQGKSLAPEILKSVFEKLDQPIEASFMEASFGLMIAKTIAEMNDGHLQATNRITGGTTFTLTLPL